MKIAIPYNHQRRGKSKPRSSQNQTLLDWLRDDLRLRAAGRLRASGSAAVHGVGGWQARQLLPDVGDQRGGERDSNDRGLAKVTTSDPGAAGVFGPAGVSVWLLCTSGMIMATKAPLVSSSPTPSEEGSAGLFIGQHLPLRHLPRSYGSNQNITGRKKSCEEIARSA